MSILEIKTERLPSPEKRAIVAGQLEAFREIRRKAVPQDDDLDTLARDLKSINGELWDVEDALRAHEKAGTFGAAFVELARSVYRLNDRRAAVKRAIDDHVGSAFAEEKSYTQY